MQKKLNNNFFILSIYSEKYKYSFTALYFLITETKKMIYYTNIINNKKNLGNYFKKFLFFQL